MSRPVIACAAPIAVRTFRIRLLFPIVHLAGLALLCLPFCASLRADTITGTVKDPSGAVVNGAHVEITGGDLAKPIGFTTDESGKFVAPNLSAGKYSVRITKEGFDDIVTAVDLHGASDLQLFLTISAQQTSV